MSETLDALEVLTVPEFLQTFKIGRTKFQQEVNAGRLGVMKIGRRTLIPVEAARDWRSNRIKQANKPPRPAQLSQVA